jgi:integrase
VSAATMVENRRLARTCLSPALGDKLITQILPREVGDLVTRWKVDCAQNTARSRFFVLRGIFADAQRERYLARNPCSLISPPARVVPTPFGWTPASLRAELDVLATRPAGDAAIVIIGGGLRAAELYDAKPDDYLKVNRTFYVRYPGRYVTAPRTIVLPAFAGAAVERLVDLAKRKSSAFLLSMHKGQRCGPRFFTRHLHESFRGAALPTLHLSHLRQAFGFLAERAGVKDSVVRYYLKMRPGGPAPAFEELRQSAAGIEGAYDAL